MPRCLLAFDQLAACFQASYAWESCRKVQVAGLELIDHSSDGLVLVLDCRDQVIDAFILDV